MEVEPTKMLLHERGCARSVSTCGACGEVVPRNERDEYEEKSHTVAKCGYFGSLIITKKLPSHLAECAERP